MVTDEERDYMYRAYNKDENSRINLGIRHRLAPLLDNHRQKIELLNILLFSLPGTPIIYYGDEIGMGDNVHLGDRDGVRTPMQWNLDRNAGFSDAHPHKLYLPLINDPEYHHTAVNVEVQEQNNALLLWWMKRLIRLRKRYKAFGRGDIQFLSPENPKVLAFTRSYKDEHLLIIANLSRHPQVADLQLPGFEGYQLREVFGRTWFPSVQRGANRFTLGAYGYYWFALETAANEKGYWQPPETVAWPVRGWTEKALLPKNRAQFTSAIRMYIERSTLYGAPLRLIDEVAIHAHQILHWQQNEVLWLVVEVRFTEGFPEYYSLPVIGLPLQQQNGKAALSHPDTILLLEQEEERGYLADASGLSGFQAFLLTELLSQSPGLGNPFHIERTITKHPENLPLFKVQTIEHGGTNRTLAFGETYFLKLYSRLSTDTNPDLEVSKMAKEKGLPAPGYLGHLSLENPANKQPWVLALLQPYVKNQGTAFMHFQDACRRYLEEVMSMQEVTGEWPKPHLAIERAAILGQTIAQLHQGLTDKQIKGFSSEPFSLHYQRSLFAGMQSQLRQTFNRLDKVHDRFSQGAALLQQKDRLLQLMKTVYDHPVSGLKIRIHGDLHLNHVLFDGKDFIIYDFEGERERQYSALRLRKAPYRDLACLLSSFFFVTIEALKNSDPEVRWKNSKWLALAEYWFKEVSRTLIDHYHEAINPSGIIPENRQDSQTMLRAFFIDRLLYDLNVAMVSGQKQESTVIYALLTIAETDEWWAIR